MANNNTFSFPTTTEFELGLDSAAADRIFHNGKLTPHEFRIHPSLPLKRCDSSSSSKHSWRSSSIGSSSARSDHNLLANYSLPRNGGQRRRRSTSSLTSRQWQFIAGMPALTLEHGEAVSRRRTKSGDIVDGEGKGPHKKKGLLRYLMSTCMQCHALEPRKELERGDLISCCIIGLTNI